MSDPEKDSANPSPITLSIGEEDFEEAVVDRIRGLAAGRRALGPETDKRTAVFDALPKALAKRVRGMVPDGFVVREIEFKVALSGAPFGVGVGGDVTVRMGPGSPITKEAASR